jgi:putative phage-type endonuclease
MITEAQRLERRKYLGSSDAPAILGVNPWKNAADVYWDKIQPPSENESNPTSEAAIIGNLCEGAVLDWFTMETGKKILKNQQRVHDNKIMAANFDALVIDENEGVEAKTTGIINPFDREEWGEPGTDAVPERVIVQCQHQMAVLPKLEIVWVPVLLGGVGFRLYQVERNNELIKSLEEIEVNFWNSYVSARVAPDDYLPAIDTIKSISRIPSKTVSLENFIVEDWLKAKEAKSIAEKAEEEAKRVLLAALGDAEAGECSMGTLTYFEQKRKSYVVQASTYRVARFKERKEVAA